MARKITSAKAFVDAWWTNDSGQILEAAKTDASRRYTEIKRLIELAQKIDPDDESGLFDDGMIRFQAERARVYVGRIREKSRTIRNLDVKRGIAEEVEKDFDKAKEIKIQISDIEADQFSMYFRVVKAHGIVSYLAAQNGILSWFTEEGEKDPFSEYEYGMR